MANFSGTAGGDSIFATNTADTIDSGGGGDDAIVAMAGADVISFINGDLTALDQINGGNGQDELDLAGSLAGINAVVFGPNTVINVETIVCAGGFAYDLTSDDNTVAATKTLFVDDTAGVAGTGGLRWDGSAEQDGYFILYGGGAGDTLIGGALDDNIRGGGHADGLHGLGGQDNIRGNGGADLIDGGAQADTLRGNGGSDVFFYGAVSDSTSINYDTNINLNFNNDLIDVQIAVTGTDGYNASNATIDAATFDANMGAAALLLANHASIYIAQAGDQAGKTFLLIDQNSVNGYQGGADIVIELVNSQGAYTAANFI